MKRDLIVNIGPFENRIAMLENNKLVELYTHKEGQHECVGNIYKGVVKDNVPGMAGSFIDIGLNRTALLHFRDAVPDFLNLTDSIKHSRIKKAQKSDKKMGELLQSGQEVIVQVEKAPIGKKGARLTGELSIPGKYMVLIPNKDYVAISRKIRSKKEKYRLKKIMYKIKGKNMGIIVRTNAAGKKSSEFKREYKKLSTKWKDIKNKYVSKSAPACLHDKNDLISVLVNDLIHKKIDSMIINDKKLRDDIVKELKSSAPNLLKKVKLYNEQADIFGAFGVEKEIQKIFYPRIYLDSGGFIVIQQTEALVSIDVNTGSFVGGDNLEKTVTTTNVDAAKEIARQIRLQDLTGMIFIDFIDMKDYSNRKKVVKTFKKEMHKDYSPHKIFTSSPLNMVEMTRKRTRTDVISSYFENCPYCQSVGRVLSRSTIVNKILKWLERAEKYHPVDMLEIKVNPRVYHFAKKHENKMDKDHHFTWSLKMDAEIPYNEFAVYSIKSQKDITDLYKT